MDNVEDRLADVSGKIGSAVSAVGADGGASPVLVAVVGEFGAKAAKASKLATTSAQAAHDAVVELEQAGDSAKAATEADPSVGGNAKQAVLDAHMAICVMKSKLQG